MNEAMAHTRATQADPVAAPATTVGITPELVRQVTEKVYALLLADLKRERERMPLAQWGDRLPGGK